MRRFGILPLTAILGFLGGMLAQQSPPVEAQGNTVTSAGSFKTTYFHMDKKPSFHETVGWVVRDGELYRCTRRVTINTPPEDVSLDCAMQTLRCR